MGTHFASHESAIDRANLATSIRELVLQMESKFQIAYGMQGLARPMAQHRAEQNVREMIARIDEELANGSSANALLAAYREFSGTLDSEYERGKRIQLSDPTRSRPLG